MILYDLGQVSRRKKTPEGYLNVDAKLARTGIQVYDAVQDFKPGVLPPSIPQVSGQTVRLLRPEKEVFSDATLKSCRNKPITDGHPSEAVSDENVRKWAVGFSKDSVTRDGDLIAASLVIQAKSAVTKIEKMGVNQVSLGYDTEIVWDSGTDPDFGEYDGVQTNIDCNHIAIVKTARGGSDVRLSDGAKDKREIKIMATRLFDGLTIEVTDQGGQAIDKLATQLADSKTDLENVSTQLKDAKIKADRLEGELDAEKAKALNVEAIDSMVEKRMALVDSAHKLDPKLEAKGLSDHEVRKNAIMKASDSFDLSGKSEEYVEAVFDTMVKSVPKESAALKGDLSQLNDGQADPVDTSRAAMIKRRSE